MKIDSLLNEYKKISMFDKENNALTVTETLDIIEKAIITSRGEDYMRTALLIAYKIGFVKGKRYTDNTRKG